MEDGKQNLKERVSKKKIISQEGQEEINSEKIITEDSSIIMIKNKKNDQSFSFGPVSYDVFKKVKTLDTAKAPQQSDIPTKILKTKFRLFCRVFLRKYQPEYVKINIPIRFEIR